MEKSVEYFDDLRRQSGSNGNLLLHDQKHINNLSIYNHVPELEPNDVEDVKQMIFFLIRRTLDPKGGTRPPRYKAWDTYSTVEILNGRESIGYK